MASTQATTVSTTTVQISPGLSYGVVDSRGIVVSNTGATDMFIGALNVTTTTGVIVKAGTNLPLTGLSGSLYAISTGAGTTAVVGVF